MKTLSIILIIILSSCAKTKYKTEKYQIYTSHDNNWSTSGRYFADSIKFVSKEEILLFKDGRKTLVKAPLIRVYENPELIK